MIDFIATALLRHHGARTSRLWLKSVKDLCQATHWYVLQRYFEQGSNKQWSTWVWVIMVGVDINTCFKLSNSDDNLFAHGGKMRTNLF